jgi:hypothetical protein
MAAHATGTMLIQRSDGDKDTYNDVEIDVFQGAMFLTSDDGDGTLVINRAACSYQAKVMVCLPTSIVLVQDGESSALNVRNGTIYINDTGDAQQLTHSTTKLKPHSAMVSFTTVSGTYVNVLGTLDQVIRK